MNNINGLKSFGNFRLDLEKKVLWHGEELVQLPGKAVELLCVLVENNGEIVTKDELLEKVWQNRFVEESVLAQNVHHLRKTFKDLNFCQNPIKTVPRRGYRFAGDVREIENDFIFEHEIVERRLLAEISEDSLIDLGYREAIKSSQPEKTKPSFIFSKSAVFLTLILVALSIGFAAWSFNQTAKKTSLENIKSIAVLPLKNLNGNTSNPSFSLGLTDSLISRLGKTNRFAVRPYSAVEKYEESGKDAVAFGQYLKVDAVLEGTIQQTENRLRVNLRLINAQTGEQLWTENFDESEADILKLQDSVSIKTAKILLGKISPEENLQIAGNPTSNAEAYRFYMIGRERWLRRDWSESFPFYQEAIKLDPNFALAHLGIADHFAFQNQTKSAEQSLDKALQLDPNLAEAHATRGFLRMFHHWDWQGAENSLRRALELSPNSSKAHHWFGVYLSLRGRHDEALREMEKALELDPTALVILTDIAEIYYFKRDYQRAETELQKVLEIDPNFELARRHLIKVRYQTGASYLLEKANFYVFFNEKKKAEGFPQNADYKEIANALEQKNEETLKQIYLSKYQQLAEKNPNGNLLTAAVYFASDKKELSLKELEKASKGKAFLLPFIAVDPFWDKVKNEPQFQNTLRSLNLSVN